MRCSHKRNEFLSMRRRGGRKMVSFTVPKKPKCAIQHKLDKLRRIIPGGQKMDVETLFRLTIQQILMLQLKVNVLQRLSELYGV
uniref:BHLH domain-containing protein n=1 Tax=Nelumbo nucifera TaxID=4432 RepID=A0A822Y8D9_NELNU|nr:TPA_asm: hypothetical protein HUJ06_029037 [Nelumbo nucifera]